MGRWIVRSRKHSLNQLILHRAERWRRPLIFSFAAQHPGQGSALLGCQLPERVDGGLEDTGSFGRQSYHCHNVAMYRFERCLFFATIENFKLSLSPTTAVARLTLLTTTTRHCDRHQTSLRTRRLASERSWKGPILGFCVSWSVSARRYLEECPVLQHFQRWCPCMTHWGSQVRAL